MFFLSSILDNGLLGVMDTNDCVEEFYATSDLIRLMNLYNIVIEGLTISESELSFSICEAWNKNFYYYYVLNDVIEGSDKVFVVTKHIKLYRINGSGSLDTSEGKNNLTLKDIVKLRLAEIPIQGYDRYIQSRISDGDKVLFLRYKDTAVLAKKEAIPNSIGINPFRNLDLVDLYNVYRFDSDISALQYVKSHNLNLLNDFYDPASDTYRVHYTSRGNFSIDQYLELYSKCIPIGQFILAHCTEVASNYLRKKGKVKRHIFMVDKVKCSFNPEDNTFRFVQKLMDGVMRVASFTLTCTEPEDTDLIGSIGYDWLSDKRKYGVCLSTVKLDGYEGDTEGEIVFFSSFD